ncbi:uncharacterized protein [Dermacentor albipictus]|uniref:uncharacterized protein isoform X3 n=1 Tax=Dermacentor albipictus TaxID=60249 RepID=UPI0038FC983C
MAFSLLPFDRLSVKQLHIVAAQRRRNGFHAYYTGGFDATRKQFGFITPGYLLRGCSITTVFLYPSPGATAGGSKTMYATNLGQYSKHLRYLVSLTFKGDTDAYVEYWYANVKQSGYDLSSRDLKGFHVVQYEVNENGLQVIVDGESVIPPGTITGVDEYTVYYTNSTLELAPFAFFESHYTMDDVAAIINASVTDGVPPSASPVVTDKAPPAPKSGRHWLPISNSRLVTKKRLPPQHLGQQTRSWARVRLYP